MTATFPGAGTGTKFLQAKSACLQAPLPRPRPQTAFQQADRQVITRHMFALMFWNVSSDGFLVTDPINPTSFSKPGCVIAVPTYPAGQRGADQDYIFNGTRDAAITAMELAAAATPTRPHGSVQPLIDYVNFAKVCRDNAALLLSRS